MNITNEKYNLKKNQLLYSSVFLAYYFQAV
jgi:hypothetical protein